MNDDVKEDGDEEPVGFRISNWFKFFVCAITVPIIVTILCLYWLYINEPYTYKSPELLGLPSILIFCISLLVFTFIPWDSIRHIFKKIGPFELQEILNTQATERDQDLSDVDDRLTELEDKIFDTDEMSFVSKSFYGPKIRELLIAFLKEYDPTPYSPLRIKKWACKQEGYEDFENFELPHIRQVLRELVSEQKLTTVVSTKGNTLYKLID